MKKILIGVCAASVLIYANLSVEQIEEMVLRIHEKREGVRLKTLESTKNPFIRLNEEDNTTIFSTSSEEDAKLDLNAIVNGKAFINDAWRSVDDVVLGYTLKYIGQGGVVLRSGNHIRKLYLNEKKHNFITIEER
jgi:hypothetical protein